MVYDFGFRLKELREAKRLSQTDVADRLEVTRSTISGYECNTITPSVEQLKRLAVLYNASLDYIMGMDDRSALYLDDLTESQQQTLLERWGMLTAEQKKVLLDLMEQMV